MTEFTTTQDDIADTLAAQADRTWRRAMNTPAIFAAYETARDDIHVDTRVLNVAEQLSAMLQAGEFSKLPEHTLRMLEHLPPVLAEIAGDVFTLRTLAARQRGVEDVPAVPAMP
jgi:hypothetical protein